MSTRRVKLTLSPQPEANRVTVDGYELAGMVNLVSVQAQPGRVPLLVLGVQLLPDRHIVEGEMRVSLSEDNRADLLALGWTPPADEPGASELVVKMSETPVEPAEGE